MRNVRFIVAVTLVGLSASAYAQQTDTNPVSHQHSSDGTVALFPSREASGTAWLPDETPMYGIARRWRSWDVMLHGTAFAQFLYEPGDKHRTGGFSDKQISSVN